ncbi:uncharacterized protein LOC129589793 [Paramacrobiotus metropolitanus]|uniref:uncharacterized protein LOC129589793 n=1 Tax=Paramacrobiotus metropolitanus TaxID=2943436 RepID=UPI002445FE10|nr:uncharacterized protein LOC129589793 [Paramacrobiotus metropolitanus]XP_055340639.1 uncharacterized protein LOC129589793 [Paramacrobiotus metropolitanus]
MEGNIQWKSRRFYGIILVVLGLFGLSMVCDAGSMEEDRAAPRAGMRRSLSNYYSSNSTKSLPKTCPTCATCPPPCPAAQATVSSTSTCSDNPCYFPSLPFACSAEQCADFLAKTAEYGKAVIVNLPEELCVTTCQLQNTKDYPNAMLYTFGACTRYESLDVGIYNNDPEPKIVSTLKCGDNKCFYAQAYYLFYGHTECGCCEPVIYTQDTVLQCTLTLTNSQQNNELYATAQFRLKIQYVDQSECGPTTTTE